MAARGSGSTLRLPRFDRARRPDRRQPGRRAGAADSLLARVASALAGSEAHRLFGYARWSDFVRERYQRSGRWLKDLAALHRLFQALPGLREAVGGEDGGEPLGVSAALAIGRAASPSTVAGWIARGRAVSLAKLRQEVRRSLQAGSDRPIAEAQESSPSGAAGDPAPAAGSGIEPVPERGTDAIAEDEDERLEVRLQLPPAVRAIFQETLELYRSLEGGEATVTSFIEALVAESLAGRADAVDDPDRTPPL